MSSEARKSFKEKLSSTFGLRKEDEAMAGKISPPGGSVAVTSSSKGTQLVTSSHQGVTSSYPGVTSPHHVGGAHGHMNPLDWDTMPPALLDRLQAGKNKTEKNREVGQGEKYKLDDLGSTPVIMNTSQGVGSTPQGVGPTPQGVGPTSLGPLPPLSTGSTPLSSQPSQNSQNGLGKQKPRPLKPKGTKEYIVSDRDSIRSIAAIFDTTPSELKKLNKLMSDMVFPGKKLYVPDKEYIPSPPRSPDTTSTDQRSSGSPSRSSPRSPKSPPVPFDLLPMTEQARVRHLSGGGQSAPKDIPVVRQADRQKKPGRVERMNSEEDRRGKSGGGGGGGGVVKPLSEEQAKRLDQECYERFIKVNVKHITDGQGVVSGTLLVTPNAIMFDPNVSDTLVIEHGADMYGMIAPMETVISAAMYHDIAAMKLKGQKKLEQDDAPEVYHTSDCPLNTTSSQPPDNTGNQGDNTSNGNQDANGNPPRSDVITSCSCDSNVTDAQSDVTNQNVVAMETSSDAQSSEVKAGNMADVSAERSEDGGREEESEGVFTVGSLEGGDPELGGDKHLGGGTGARDSQCDAESTSEGHVTDRDQSEPRAVVTTETRDATGVQQQPAEKLSDKITEGASSSTPPTGETTAAPAPPGVSPQQQNFQQQQEEDTESDVNSQQAKPSAASAAIPIPGSSNTTPSLRRSAHPGSLTDAPSHTPAAGRTPPTPPNTPGGGLLDRTLGSLSSIGSPISSNLTKVVNFSSGLFVRSAETQGSVVDFADMFPQDSTESVSQNVPKDASVQDGKSSGGHSGGQGQSQRQAGESNPRHSREVTVESVVRLHDKPELFKNLAALDLVPKPAAQFEDPPLYLCLRIGVPINKTVSKTCPIESYKKRSKPEYWFSIPREKVDPLYAFFIQWSPDIYGGEDEIDPTERGFIVITEEEAEGAAHPGGVTGGVITGSGVKLGTPVEDHFKAGSMSKDWEIVNMEEARRRMSLLGEGDLPLPDLSNPSTILNEEQIKKLCNHLPPRAEGYPWTMVYSTDKHGFSLKTLYRSMVGFDSPMLLTIKDTHNQIFGALISCPLRMSDHFYGTGESFLFTFHSEFKKFKWTGLNSFFVKGNQESLWIGAGGEGNGLWLDGDIYHGRTQHCDTFNNEQLTDTEDFMVKGMEAWAFV